ncbi:hypothetical protein AVEN_95223-1 [Araneus ventricosus]|nr:hypothetical protein AVEN_95223-1 [Araneus ventricosus]
MPLTVKQCGEMVKLFYLNGQNAAEALSAYRRNYSLRRDSCSAQAVRNLIRKFEETGCTCDRFLTRRHSFLVEVVAEAHQAKIALETHEQFYTL